MMNGSPRSPLRPFPAVGVAALLAAMLLVTGCGARKSDGVDAALARAGEPEPGTTATWISSWEEGEAAEAIERIVADPDGRWASSAEASSSFSEVSEEPGWTPEEATGAPDMTGKEFSGRAWGPREENAGYEWLELSYEVPVNATSVRIRFVYGIGAMVMVELKDTEDRYHVKWKGGAGTTGYGNWLVLDFPETPYLVDGVRLTLDTFLVADYWKLVDAVQLVGRP